MNGRENVFLPSLREKAIKSDVKRNSSDQIHAHSECRESVVRAPLTDI